MNTIETAKIFQTELDKAAVEQSTSGWMELNDKLIKYDGGAEVKIPDLSMDGLADYDRNSGFVDGDVNLKWQTKDLTQDRGRRFTIDEHDTTETAFVLTASSIMGEFQRTKVVPEIDAYRYSKIGSICLEKKRASGGYTATEADVLQKLYYDIAAVQDVVGDSTPLVITISAKVAAILNMSEKFSKVLDVTNFKQGDATFKVKTLDGIHPLIPVGSGRLKTAYVFQDGKTEGQEKGGFVAATGAKSMNWIITPKAAPVAVSRTDKMRIFTPDTYQAKRAWAMDYRKFHDLWITDQKAEQCWINCAEALTTAESGGKE